MKTKLRKLRYGYVVKLIGVFAVLAMLAACAPRTPEAAVSPLTSPLGGEDSPLATPAGDEKEAFQMDKPLVAGMKTITGRGPAEMPVLVADVTGGGEILGRATTNRRGEFEIRLNAPLEARHRVGLTLGDLTGTGKQYEDFYSEEYYGDEALLVPQVGFFFDTAMVREKE